jgi:hypothetical protein
MVQTAKQFTPGVIFSPTLKLKMAEAKAHFAASVSAAQKAESERPVTIAPIENSPGGAGVGAGTPSSHVAASKPLHTPAVAAADPSMHVKDDGLDVAVLLASVPATSPEAMVSLAEHNQEGSAVSTLRHQPHASRSGGSPQGGRSSLRTPCVSRSGGSPHAGGASPQSPSTPTRRGSPSYEDVVAFGGIMDHSKMALRSSSRIQAQPNADAPQMERAMELAARRTPSSAQGTNFIKKLNFVDLPDSEIEHRASILGISLGQSLDQVLSSIKSLKKLEVQRNLIFLNKSTNLGEDSSSLVLSKASNLSEDLVDADNDDHEDLMHVPLIKWRNKNKIKSSRLIRRSSRIKKLKNLEI